MTEDDPGPASPAACDPAEDEPPNVDVEIVHADWRQALDDVEGLCRAAAAAALDAAGFAPLASVVELGLRLSDDAEVRVLNRRYRHRDAATDVLSFPAADCIPGEPPMAPPSGAPLALGDVVLAFETVRDAALEQGRPLADHLRHLVVHGVLHLAGYDHLTDDEAAAMETMERTVLAGLGVADPVSPDQAPPSAGHTEPQTHGRP